MEEVSQLGCAGSGNKLQRFKKRPLGILGKESKNICSWGKEKERGFDVLQREHELEKEEGGKGSWMPER